jgi:hypothetical protein
MMSPIFNAGGLHGFKARNTAQLLHSSFNVGFGLIPWCLRESDGNASGNKKKSGEEKDK